ncbi:MAG: short-chain dehydrogenase [Nitrospirales bacterium]|nr:MAG: short-chain dehydrogenase [Nitrospirales bacterium]
MSSLGKDRRMVVTGGAGALGLAVVRKLVSEGVMCHVPCKSEEDRVAVSALDTQLVQAVAGLDLTNEDTVTDFYSEVAASGNFSGSIHLVGGFFSAPILETSCKDFVMQFELNVVTAFLCSREAVRHFRNSGQGGCLVNVTARPGSEPRTGAGLLAYTTSKSAVAAFSQCLGEELSEERIWVNAIAPSIMDTPANRVSMPDENFDAWVKVEDVASTIAFLVSEENHCVRSGIVPVYGSS